MITRFEVIDVGEVISPGGEARRDDPRQSVSSVGEALEQRMPVITTHTLGVR